MLNPNKQQTKSTFSKSQLHKFVKVCVDNKLSTDYKRIKRKDGLVLEISGMPRAYKSTLILSSSVNMRTNKIPSGRIRERPANIDKINEPLHYTLSISNNSMQTLIEEKFRKENKTITFMDRGIYDRLAFLYAYKKLKRITEDEYEAICRYLIKIFANNVDGLIVCVNSPSVSLKRDGRKDGGTIVSREFLPYLHEGYKRMIDEIVKYRDISGLSNKPLLIAQLDSSEKWERYSDNFLKSVGSMYSLAS